MKRLACLLALLVAPAVFAAEMAKPNFVVFISDDHGWWDATPYGATDVRTPNMERLARAGATFTHAFVASPSCAPSRAALLTGLMPARNGAEANHTYKREGIRSLTENLKALGYEIAAFGKVAHGQDVNRHGFDRFDRRFNVAFVESFLKERDDARPLCLFVGTPEPHVPWPDLEGYDPAQVKLPPTHSDTPETREYRARYYTDITRADRQLGETYDLARRYCDPKNTLFLYTTDNGAQWPFAKWNLYDAGIRTPFLAVWPGVIEPGTRSAALISWVDILPTFIDLAGGPPPKDIDGRSFAGVLRGTRQEHRERLFATHTGDGRMNIYPIRAVRTKDWHYILNLHPEFEHTTWIDLARDQDGLYYWRTWAAAASADPRAAAIVKRYHERPREELYDVRVDPHETNNLVAAPEHADVRKQLAAQLEAWMKQQGDTRKVHDEPRLLSDR